MVRTRALRSLTKRRTLRNKSQTIKIHVGAREDADICALGMIYLGVGGNVLLGTGKERAPESSSKSSGIIKHVLNGSAELIDQRKDDLVDDFFVNTDVLSPTILTAVPSANKPTSFNMRRLPAVSESFIAWASSVSTPMTLIWGAMRLMYAPIPAMRPPPPMATKMALSSWMFHWLRVSLAMVKPASNDLGIIKGRDIR